MENKKTAGNTSLIDQKEIKNTLVNIGKNWYWFLIFLILGAGGSMIYLYESTKIYGAATELLVKTPKDPFKDALSDAMPIPTKKEELENEKLIITSSQLIGETLRWRPRSRTADAAAARAAARPRCRRVARISRDARSGFATRRPWS